MKRLRRTVLWWIGGAIAGLALIAAGARYLLSHVPAGAWLVRNDEFNCLSRYSDAPPESCAELRFMVAAGTELTGAFKPPSLRNVAQTGPYMHAGQFTTLREVLEHYNRAPAAPVGRTELKPLQLSAVELAQLEAFLRSLSGAIAFQ